jgi:serine-type D-Ala-D-Ala carboxypeptidase (penicillin-binding protein 5/6)
MPLRFYVLLFLFTLLFLYYPGDSPYFHIFAYHRQAFLVPEDSITYNLNPIPILKYATYPEVSGEGVYVVDLPSFTPVLERNSNQKFFPASTTKVITALVAYDVFKPDQVVTVKQVLNEGQVMGLIPGERISVENLMYGILIQSGNDAAYALAHEYGYDEFIELMNKKAKSLGMKNTHFVNPAGLDHPEQISSPVDLALAARELLKNHYLGKIVSIKEIVISDVDFKMYHKLTNVNKLLGEVQGLGGLKTGYTEQAGENLVSFYKSNNHEFIIVVLKSKDRFEDTKSIVRWINENVDYINTTDNLKLIMRN